MNAVELGPVPLEARTQPAVDLFLIFAGANIVATTLLTGASLATGVGTRDGLLLVLVGSVVGSALVAALSPVGPRLGVPSVVAARSPLGRGGAGLLAAVLYVTNFAWIALNNVIAANVCAAVWGGPRSEGAWAVGLGLLATAVVAAGPRAVGWADRLAVPMMAVVGTVMLLRCLDLPFTSAPFGAGAVGRLQGLDVVISYQVSWILMFADYSRYTRSARAGALAVFLGLALSSLWFMGMGLLAAGAAHSPDPARMLEALHLGAGGAVLVALATLTTNFVNIYLSALAWKSLWPGAGDQFSVWSIGVVGAALSLLGGTWLDRYADFMLVLGALLVPVGGVFLARFHLVREPVDVPSLYAPDSPRFAWPGLLAWGAGALAYRLCMPWGGTLPGLAVATLAYALLVRRR